jgi:hypothetical protein
MVCKSAIVAGALLVIAAAASPASAITVGPHSKAPVATKDSLAQPVQWGWWRTPRFYACVDRRGCGGPF